MSNKYDFYDLEKVEELAGRPETIEIDGYYWDPTDLPPKDYLDTQVPASFKNIGKWMRSKMNGLQTRETMARLAEMVGINTHKAVDVAERTQLRQDNLEIKTAQDVAQMEADKNAVIANVTVDSEVILARGGKVTLGQRFDETTAQLEQKITDGSGIITMDHLSQAVKTAMTGGSVAVVGEGAVGVINLNAELSTLISDWQAVLTTENEGWAI